ncbi:hypothetical protein E2C01_042388 [Portunus trituberculatus]|uniref:Uncharacterized protein n=1 Tax=Portunus trituberculatus TaxID=210409 RepID=A0A5B7FTJ5_PORTR|nr:hypothetical protein [Portunus trituberculatus]
MFSPPVQISSLTYLTRFLLYYAFFSRHPPRNVGATLPQMSGSAEERDLAHELLRQTHLNIAIKFRAVGNRNQMNQKLEEGSLI